MASNHTAATGTFESVISMLDGSDVMSATQLRQILESLHDNTAYNERLVSLQRLYCALQFAEVRREGVVPTDLDESLGVVQRTDQGPAVLVKTAEAFGVGALPRFAVQGVPASITSLVTDAATNGTRIIAIGTGGNRNTFSDDDGVTWTAGGTMGATPKRLVYNPTHDMWTASVGATDVRTSNNDGMSWVNGTTPGIDTPAGLAVVSNGDTFGISSINAIRRSTSGGNSWTTVAGAVPNSGSLDDSGCVVGNGGAVFYHCGRFSSGARLQVASSAAGTSWTLLATLTAPAGVTFSSRPRILMCQNTGLLAIAAPITDDRCLVYASRDGATWAGPVSVYPDVGVDAFGVAGGRIFVAQDAQFFVSQFGVFE